MTDILLTVLIHISELPESVETDVTLIVGGSIVSGKIISYSNYLKTNTIFQAFGDELSKRDGEDNKADSGTRNFIHLSDAKIFAPGNKPIPDNAGLFLRIPLAQVQGFSIGRLVANQT